MNSDKRIFSVAVLALAVTLAGCSGELTDNAAPVELIVTNTQNLQIIDFSDNDDPDCDDDIGTINMQVIAKRTDLTGTMGQVRVTRYRVSYQRTDGGTLVPASFVRPLDTLIGVGQTSGFSRFLVLEPDAILQAPFAALLPQNGGRDPQTGRPIVKLDVIVEIFGETLAGDNVYDSTRFPLDFCFGCGCD